MDRAARLPQAAKDAVAEHDSKSDARLAVRDWAGFVISGPGRWGGKGRLWPEALARAGPVCRISLSARQSLRQEM